MAHKELSNISSQQIFLTASFFSLFDCTYGITQDNDLENELVYRDFIYAFHFFVVVFFFVLDEARVATCFVLIVACRFRGTAFPFPNE